MSVAGTMIIGHFRACVCHNIGRREKPCHDEDRSLPCRSTCTRRLGGARANISVQADHADHSVRGRGIERFGRARHRQEACRGVGPAGRRRKPCRRGRPDRHLCRRHRAAGRLHAPAGVANLHDQPGDQEEHAVRHGQGLHTGRLYCPLAAAGHRVERTTGEVREGIARSGEEQTGPDHLRFSRSRQHQSDFDRTHRAFGGSEVHARSLQGRCAGAQRSRRRPCRHLCIESSAGAADRPKRAGQGPCRDKRPANGASA